MSKDQEVTLSLVLILALVVLMTSGAITKFFGAVLSDILTYHPTQLNLTPKLELPSINVQLPGTSNTAGGTQQ